MRVIYPPPDPTVLFYVKDENSSDKPLQIGTIQTIILYGGGRWRALFLVPGQAPETIDQHTSPLNEWDPVRAIAEDDKDEMIETIAQRVVEIMQDKGASPVEIVAAGMAVVMDKTVEDAIDTSIVAVTKERHNCSVCQKEYVYSRALRTHMKKAHPAAAVS